MNPASIPWRSIRRDVRLVRSAFFSIKKPTGVPSIKVEGASLDDIGKVLESVNFEDGWYLSYKEQGEMLNCRRPQGTSTVRGDKGLQMQLHVRGWHLSNGVVELHPHYEVSPLSTRPDLHVRDIGLDKPKGVKLLEPILKHSNEDWSVSVDNMPKNSSQ